MLSNALVMIPRRDQAFGIEVCADEGRTDNAVASQPALRGLRLCPHSAHAVVRVKLCDQRILRVQHGHDVKIADSIERVVRAAPFLNDAGERDGVRDKTLAKACAVALHGARQEPLVIDDVPEIVAQPGEARRVNFAPCRPSLGHEQSLPVRRRPLGTPRTPSPSTRGHRQKRALSDSEWRKRPCRLRRTETRRCCARHRGRTRRPPPEDLLGL